MSAPYWKGTRSAPTTPDVPLHVIRPGNPVTAKNVSASDDWEHEVKVRRGYLVQGSNSRGGIYSRNVVPMVVRTSIGCNVCGRSTYLRSTALIFEQAPDGEPGIPQRTRAHPSGPGAFRGADYWLLRLVGIADRVRRPTGIFWRYNLCG
jgi:hypothetical protein